MAVSAMRDCFVVLIPSLRSVAEVFVVEKPR